MSQLVKDRFTRLLDSAILVVGTKEIVHAMVFAKIGRYSAYIEPFYMHTPHVMILIVEPVSKPWNRAYIPAWRGELLDVILGKLASAALVAGSYYTYVSLRLCMQNAVPTQPCVGKLGISLVLLNFLHCNFRLRFKTP